MTVQELKETLKKFPKEATVKVKEPMEDSNSFMLIPIDKIVYDKSWKSVFIKIK